MSEVNYQEILENVNDTVRNLKVNVSMCDMNYYRFRVLVKLDILVKIQF